LALGAGRSGSGIVAGNVVGRPDDTTGPAPGVKRVKWFK
jgi:hypothetical protein